MPDVPYTRKTQTGGDLGTPSNGTPSFTSGITTALPGRTWVVVSDPTTVTVEIDGAALTPTEQTDLDDAYTAWNPDFTPPPPEPNGNYTLNFGAVMNGADRYARANGTSDLNDEAALGPLTEAVVPRAGTIAILSWNSLSADNTTVVNVVVNGSPTAVALTGPAGVVDMDVAVAAGAKIAVQNSAGVFADNATFIVFIR